MADTLETAIDRTMILDPAKLWPDPLACPDWPFETATRRHEGRRGRAGAEERLAFLGEVLNRSGKVHAPTDDEREGAFDRVFARAGSAFHHLGLANLSPLDRTVESQAQTIVDAAHVRGYLRKLDALEAKAAQDAIDSKAEQAKRTLERFNQSLESGHAEMAQLAEAAARHKQRLEDQRAFERCLEIKINLRHGHMPAAQAAVVLGVDAPPMPTFD